jgi:hypothetical protein
LRLIRRLPVFAAGLGLAVALVAVADAREWSGVETAGGVFAVGVFYVVTILVPWLIREQVGRQVKTDTNGHGRIARLSVDFVSYGNGDIVVLTPDPGPSPRPVTRGELPIRVVEHPATASG